MTYRVDGATEAHLFDQTGDGGSIPTSALALALPIPADLNAFGHSVNKVLQYLKANEITLDGYTYGSTRWQYRPGAVAKLRRYVEKSFEEVTGKLLSKAMPHISDVGLLDAYNQCREYGWQDLRDGVPLTPYASTCYAYMGWNAKYRERRLLKLGYTSGDLVEYLRSKAMGHDPILLATTEGGERQEKKYKHKWNHLLAVGREWFFPRSEIFDWLESVEWDTVSNFQQLRKEHCES